MLLGATVNLQFSNQTLTGEEAKLLQINLANGESVEVSYAYLVSLPDFIGDIGAPIGGHDPETNKAHFAIQFNALLDEQVKEYLPEVMNIIQQELIDNQDNINNHQPLEIDLQDDIRLNCATGGGCDPLSAVIDHGLYFKLLLRNYDHFGQAAIDSYMAGHAVALQTAYNAQSDEELKLAYAYDAYANHFLTDLFAAGHVRTPRTEISQWCSNTPIEVSAYLAKVMHDQDGETGIWFKNNKNERWYGYGDNFLFIEDNSANLARIQEAMQKSADQIYAVYNHSLDSGVALAEMMFLLPNFTLINTALNNNPPPLFKEIDGALNEYVDGAYEVVDNCLLTAIRHGFSLP
jgi:hypothetical protein